MMAVRTIAYKLLNALDGLFARLSLTWLSFNSSLAFNSALPFNFAQTFNVWLKIRPADNWFVSNKHVRPVAVCVSKPIKQLISVGFIGFLISTSLAHAAAIKIASADKESLLIPNTVNIDENPPTFSSHIKTLAASCAACHGTNGNSVGGMPVLAGLDPTRFVVQMQAFRSGEAASTVMHYHAKGLTPEEIEQLSRYFAAQNILQVAVPANQKLDTRHDD